MEDALPPSAPHHHGQGHGHEHGHGHQHGHAPHHDHAHHHHDIPAPAVSNAGGFSLIALSSAARLALAVPPVALLWLLTAWAMKNG